MTVVIKDKVDSYCTRFCVYCSALLFSVYSSAYCGCTFL